MNYREDFLQTPEAQQFRGIVTMRAFEEASKVAMLVFTEQHCSSESDPAQASANNFRLDGARQFLNVLQTIAKERPPRKPLKSAQLNHKV